MPYSSHTSRIVSIHTDQRRFRRCSQIIRTCGRQPWPGEDHNLVFLGSSSSFGKVDKSRVAPAALLGERSIRPSTDFHRFRGFAPITPSNFPPSLVWAAPTRSFVHRTPPGFDSPYSTGLRFKKVLRMLAGGRRRGATRSTRCEALKSVEIGGRLYRSSRSVKLTKGSPSACRLPKCDDEPTKTRERSQPSWRCRPTPGIICENLRAICVICDGQFGCCHSQIQPRSQPRRFFAELFD